MFMGAKWNTRLAKYFGAGLWQKNSNWVDWNLQLFEENLCCKSTFCDTFELKTYRGRQGQKSSQAHELVALTSLAPLCMYKTYTQNWAFQFFYSTLWSTEAISRLTKLCDVTQLLIFFEFLFVKIIFRTSLCRWQQKQWYNLKFFIVCLEKETCHISAVSINICTSHS